MNTHAVADTLRIHVTIARFHLTTLETQGYVRRAGSRRVGTGRPKLTYEPAPRLDYADIVSLFAAHLGGTPAGAALLRWFSSRLNVLPQA